MIATLEALIAKKRDIKQGAMQELLTGQRRLPGFEGEWEVTRLVGLASVDGDNLRAGTPSDYEFRYISLEDVDVGVLKSYSEQRFASAPSRARRRLAPGDVLVSTVRPNLKSHLLFDKREGEWVCSTGFSVVRAYNGVLDPEFLFQVLFSTNIERMAYWTSRMRCAETDLMLALGPTHLAAVAVRCAEIGTPSAQETLDDRLGAMVVGDKDGAVVDDGTPRATSSPCRPSCRFHPRPAPCRPSAAP